jgi:SAM-dependent methyltransferase
MNFSKEWDERYKQHTQMSIWPWSDLVSYVMRYCRPSSSDFKVLELGCGAGANIPFFRHLGVEYYAIEGSRTIVESLWAQYPELRHNILIGDITAEIPFEVQFDLIVDRSSLTHNTSTAIKDALFHVFNHLKAGCKYVGIDWFATLHSDFGSGEPVEDEYTKTNYKKGQFAQIGRVHFSDKKHLEELFAGFEIEIMELKTIKREIPENAQIFASWNLVAIRKEKTRWKNTVKV